MKLSRHVGFVGNLKKNSFANKRLTILQFLDGALLKLDKLYTILL